MAEAAEVRKLPSNVEAEAAFLGALLIDSELTEMVADIVRAEDFFEPLHARIFTATHDQHAKTGLASPVTLKPLFEDDAAMRELGGTTYLLKLTETGAGLLAVKELAKLIAELSRRRRLLSAMRECMDMAFDLETPVSEAIVAIDEAAGESAQTSLAESDAAECFDEMFDGYEAEDRGVTCKIIPTLDHVMGALQPGSFNILAGRPGMGKTAVALGYARGCAENGNGVLLASLEMPGDQLAQRMAADMCYDEHQLEYWAIRDGRLDRDQKQIVRDAQARLRDVPLRIACGSSLSVGRLASLIRRNKRRFAAHGVPLRLVAIDYIQLLRPDQRTNRYEAITEISMALKAMAMDNDVAILALAQLSRAVEQRDDKRPQLSDLKESGQLEQDADVVTFLLRQQYYHQKEEPPRGDEAYVEWQSALAACRDKIEFIVAKRRNGVEGTGIANFYGKYQAVRG